MVFRTGSLEIMVKRYWEDRKVFVTGATGLVGGWLIKKLIELNSDVVVLIRDFVPNSTFMKQKFFEKVTVINGDLSDSVFLRRVLNEYEVTNIIHLASQTTVPIANRSPISTYESNIRGTWNLLEASNFEKKIIKSVVIASSDKAYGESRTLPYTEETPLNAIYPYDVSKACADLISRSYANVFDVPVAITRCGNFFGGGDLNWNRLIPGTIRSLIKKQQPIIRSNGNLIRDYIYVEDVVSAYIKLSEFLSHNIEIKVQAFNFSNESKKTVLDITNLIIKLIKSNLEPIIMNEGENEISEQFLDASKAKKNLGWQPEYKIEEGLRKTINWYKEYFDANQL